MSSDDRDPIDRIAAGDSAGVLDELRRRVEVEPDDAVAWLRLGAVFLAIGHAPEAEGALARAVECDGDDVEARLLFADALTRQKKLDAAAFQLVQARRAAPGDARVHRQLGIVLLDKGLHDKAEMALAAAAELDPTDPRIPFVRGLVADARRNPAEALAHYRRAVELDPDAIDARCTLADAMAAMGEIAEAAHQLEEALRRDRTNTRIAQNLDVLRKGLRELAGRRLLGKSEADFERSMLVQRGQLKRAGRIEAGGLPQTRYRASLVEVWLAHEEERVTAFTIVLPDPERAARTPDAEFEVTVVSRTGASERADFATAVTLTFLREVLGCPMTRASELYAQLLREPRPMEWSGVRLEWCEVPLGDAMRIALRASLTG